MPLAQLWKAFSLPNCDRNGSTHSLFTFWLAQHKNKATVLLSRSSANPTAGASVFPLSILFVHIPAGHD